MATICLTQKLPLRAVLRRLIAVLCCAVVIFGAILLPVLTASRLSFFSTAGIARADAGSGDHLYTMDSDHDERYALTIDEQHANMDYDRTPDVLAGAPSLLLSLARTVVNAAGDKVNTFIHLYLDKNIIGSSE